MCCRRSVCLHALVYAQKLILPSVWLGLKNIYIIFEIVSWMSKSVSSPLLKISPRSIYAGGRQDTKENSWCVIQIPQVPYWFFSQGAIVSAKQHITSKTEIRNICKEQQEKRKGTVTIVAVGSNLKYRENKSGKGDFMKHLAKVYCRWVMGL